ncbi:unnamed protein product [Effrenium voratum]|nr:unnamed protein product [Effrenium voratum]
MTLAVWGECNGPKSPPIQWLKQEVQEFYNLVAVPLQPISIYTDTWGCKRLVTLAIRRWRAPIHGFRVSWENGTPCPSQSLNNVFELLKHWST